MCGGTGGSKDDPCEHCTEGAFKLTTCARRFVEPELVRAINMATQADKGFLPTSGGLLDQSSWFYSLWSMVNDEQIKIDNERLERR